MGRAEEGRLWQEAREVVGCAMEVLNHVGHGLLEKPYERALTVEFRLRGIPYRQQPRYPVVYKSQRIGIYIPDLVVYDKIVVDTKVVGQLTDHEVGQMLNYLRISGLGLGLLLNFRHAQLEWKRILP